MHRRQRAPYRRRNRVCGEPFPPRQRLKEGWPGMDLIGWCVSSFGFSFARPRLRLTEETSLTPPDKLMSCTTDIQSTVRSLREIEGAGQSGRKRGDGSGGARSGCNKWCGTKSIKTRAQVEISSASLHYRYRSSNPRLPSPCPISSPTRGRWPIDHPCHPTTPRTTPETPSRIVLA